MAVAACINYFNQFQLRRSYVNFLSDSVDAMTKVVVSRVAAGRSSVRGNLLRRSPEGNFRSSTSSSSSTTSNREFCCGSGCDEDNEEVFDVDEEFEEDTKTMSKTLDLCLEFKDLTYSVPHSNAHCQACKSRIQRTRQSDHNQHVMADDGEVKILRNVSGTVMAGEMLAIVGPSGSGKSTLIDALAQRIARDSLKGSITLNGEDVKRNSIIRSISAYVMQEDLLFPMLTVKETLRFAAELRLANSSVEKEARVDEVLTQLNLTTVANTIIGDEGHRGISGGERRRVSIGKGIIHDPLLLFLDEPTSGLDSTNALLILTTLQKIARTGSIVVLSMHQPSERILKLITTILFLAEGNVIFNGPPLSLRSYFETYLGYTIPEGTNSTEFALDLVRDFRGTSRYGITPLVHSYRKFSDEFCYQKFATGGEDLLSTRDPESLLPTGVRGALVASFALGKLVGSIGFLKQYRDSDKAIQRFANSRAYETYVLAWRGILNIRRTPELFIMRLVTVMISGFLLATVFWQLDSSPQGLRELLGFFAFATSTTYYTCVDTLPIFLQERYIFMREIAHDSYRISSYVLAIALINIPFLLVLAFAFSITTFWTVGLSGGAMGYIFFLLTLWASFWAGNSFATLLSALISNVITGYAVVVAALAYFLLLSGFFIERNRIPRYWIWLHYVSLIKYPYEAVLLNEFDGRSSACYETADQILSGTPFQGLHEVTQYLLKSLRLILQNTKYRHLNGSTCMMNGASVLRSQNIGELNKWSCLAVTVGFGILFRLCFYIALRCSSRRNRR
ncbi:unnamed protein product [Calypogeia fissa]